MKKLLPYILIFIALVGLWGPINKSSAQEPQTDTKTTYKLLAPLPKLGTTFDSDPNCTTTNGVETCTNPCAFGKYMNTLINLIIGFAAVLAVIMIIAGGLEYMTSELISSKESGKNRITNALLGLVIALGSWALLNTLNPELLNVCLKLPEARITIDDDVPQTPDPVTGKYLNGATKGAPWNDTTAGVMTTLPARVSVYNQQCTTIGQPSCTSTRKLSLDYINIILEKCPSCILSIQGGTEFWLHGGSTGRTNHQLNSPTIDLGLDAALTAYILSGTPQGRNRYLKDGISYLDETKTSNHWHAGN